MTRHRIGLALGSGSARGWAHIGVLRVLERMGVKPDIVCGTSVGALVGAAWLTGQLDPLQDWAKSMGLLGVLKLMDITFSRGGLVSVEKAFAQFRKPETDIPIEDLPVPFGVVATELATGREVWLREGHLLDAVRASAAIPGLFPAVQLEGRWLMDGALVNPVPVSLCRAMGADVVIAVNLNGDLSSLPRLNRATPSPSQPSASPPAPPPPPGPAMDEPRPPETALTQALTRLGASLSERTKFFATQLLGERDPVPNALEVMAGSIDIMQDRITRSRLAGEPPDVLIQPRLGHIGILDFDKAAELIELGCCATELMRPAIEQTVRART